MKHFFGIVLILFSTFPAFSQSQIIFNKTDNESYIIQYEAGRQSIKNDMFALIARGSNTSPQSIRLRFEIKQHRQILKRGSQINLLVEYDDAVLSNAPLYKGFPTADFLLPSQLDITAQLKHRNQVLNSYNATISNLGPGNNKALEVSQADSIPGARYTLEISTKTFDYNQKNKTDLQHYLNAVDQYESAVRETGVKLRETNRIGSTVAELEQLDNLQTVRNYFNTADQNLQYINTTERSAFFRELNIKQNDPDGLKSKLNNLKQKSTELKNNTQEILDNPEVFWHNKGLDMMQKRNYSRAESYFNKAVAENTQFAPSHGQLAIIHYNSGFRKKAIEELFLVKRLNPDPQTEQINNDLAAGIYDDLLLEATEHNRRGAFDDAIFALQSAEQICRDFMTVRCHPAMNTEMTRAIKGKYYILTDNAHAAIQAGKERDAEELIDHAYTYRKRNLQFIPEREEINGLILDLYDLHLSRAESYNRSQRYEAALLSLKEGERVCQKYTEINCDKRLDDGYFKAYTGIYNSTLNEAETAYTQKEYRLAEETIQKAQEIREQYRLQKSDKEDRLMLQVQNGLYNEYISKGQDENAAGNYPKALEFYNKATEIENAYSVSRNTRLPGYRTTAAKNYAYAEIDAGINSVERNQLKSARASYKNAKQIAAEYRLESDKKVSEGLKDLKDRIFRQECINAQNTFDSMMFEAETQINGKQFVDADDELQKALQHARSNADCEIDTDELSKLRSQIADAVHYQTIIKSSKKEAARRNYKTALNEYVKAGRFFNQNNIVSYGLVHQNTFEYLRNQDLLFKNYGVFYYTNNKDFEKAVLLLQELNASGFNKRDTKDNQYLLGSQLALRDFDENPGANWKSNVVRYTNNDSFFKYLKKAYKKQWKKID